MRRGFFACLFSFSLLLFSAADVAPSSKDEIFFLKNGIDRLIKQVDPNANIGIEIISLKNGERLYEKNSKSMFTPASTQKIFTAAAALDILGPGFRFETKICATQEIKSGFLPGDLYLKGSGDPSLTSDDLKDLAMHLSLTGIKTVKGDLLIDNFDFDNIVQGPGWMWDEGAEFWNSPIDGLVVNHSCVSVWVEPGSQVNAPAQISIFPSVEGVTYRNLAKTSYEEDDLRVSRHWMTKENLIEIEGVIGLNSSAVLHEIPLESPSMYAALLLRDYLAKQGIQVTGKIRYQKTPEDARCLVTHSSAPVSELIYPVMKKSDNLYSNCLFKKMGEQLTGDAGSWQNGAKTVRKFLCDKAEIDIDDLVLVDGDGESRYNLVSPHLFISFLTWMQEKFLFFPEFQASMLISGVDGKLSRRLQDPEMKGKVRAKGGRMTGISGLVGYALSKDGETLAFAILVNGFIKPAEEYENLEDQICKLLTQFSRE